MRTTARRPLAAPEVQEAGIDDQGDARPSLASTPLLPAPASAALPRTTVPVATAPTWPLSRSRAAPGLMLSARAPLLGQRTQPVEARVRRACELA